MAKILSRNEIRGRKNENENNIKNNKDTFNPQYNEHENRRDVFINQRHSRYLI